MIGEKLPAIKYPDTNGETHQIINGSDPFLLVFWDTKCGPCIELLNTLDLLAPEFPELKIIALTNDTTEEVTKFMEHTKSSWKNIPVVAGYKDEYYDQIKTQAHPIQALVTPEGVIDKFYVGNKCRQMIIDMHMLVSGLK